LYSRTELEETEKKLGDLRIDVENLESSLIEPQADKQLAETLQPDVVLLDQHHSDIQDLQREIDRREAKLPAGSKWKALKFLPFYFFTVNLFAASLVVACNHLASYL
jgi:TolA-binding protein